VRRERHAACGTGKDMGKGKGAKAFLVRWVGARSEAALSAWPGDIQGNDRELSHRLRPAAAGLGPAHRPCCCGRGRAGQGRGVMLERQPSAAARPCSWASQCSGAATAPPAAAAHRAARQAPVLLPWLAHYPCSAAAKRWHCRRNWRAQGKVQKALDAAIARERAEQLAAQQRAEEVALVSCCCHRCCCCVLWYVW
jgi:hypothetical protein